MKGKSMRRRHMLTVGAATAALVGGLTATASPASADAGGCTPAPYGTVCGDVYDSTGLHVNRVQINRFKAWPEAICDYVGVVTVYNSSGTQIFQQKSTRHYGCVSAAAEFDLSVNRYFPNNSKIAIGFYERNQHQGTVSFKITA
ncbi:hypothetical protein ACFYOV_32940 [Streptomyces sp. NPDC005931]|uniref:hypothetical protein n=1 Tax=Streptomyces sp. NPDC005931 TaxID=3364737 RepID=UPI0036A48914